MPKFLSRTSYTGEGLKGLLKDGGTKRKQAMERFAESLGGKLEAFYYAFGDDDLFAIWDIPDNVNAAAASLIVNASGASNVQLTVLLTPEEIDRATKKSVDFSPPGQ
ncbi:MAG TPA: GYD domain-containing protein [Desulfobacterales bacterium]|nr:GYD domain-containing protein [Desulfobacterales bacterium]